MMSNFYNNGANQATQLAPVPPRVQILGQPSFDTGALTSIPTKTWFLLGYLAVTRQSHSRLHLCTLLWPESSSKAAQKNLSNAIWQLRHFCGDDVFDGRSFLGLRTTMTVDVWMFDYLKMSLLTQDIHSFDEATIRSVETMIGLYRGPLLDTITVSDSAEAELWLTSMRSLFEQKYITILDRLCEYFQMKGDYARVLLIVQNSLQIDPFHEPSVQAAIMSYAQLGQRTDGVRFYERFVERLASELGLEPLQSTADLVTTLKTTTLPLTAAELTQRSIAVASHSLPHATNPLIGRESEWEAIQAFLQEGIRLLTIMGPGGIGKTRLAIEAMHRLVPRYARTFYVDCSAISDGTMLLGVLIHAVVPANHYAASSETVLYHALSGASTLLVLDNLEHIVSPGAALIHRLVSFLPQLVVLVTSRFALQISAEKRVHLAPLAAPPATPVLSAMELQRYPAVQWLLNRIELARGSFEPQPSEWTIIQTICAHLEGVPLALELVATWTALISLESIASRLDQPLNLLQGAYRDRPDHQQSMITTLNWSYELLTLTEQRLSHLLTIFADGWTLKALESIGVVCGWDPMALVVTLRSLVSKSWVSIEHKDGQPQRFRMLALMREYLQRMPGHFLKENIMDHYVDYYCTMVATTVEMIETESTPLGKSALIDSLYPDIHNIRHALSYASVHTSGIALKIAASMELFWLRNHLWNEGKRWLETNLKPSLNVASAIKASAMHALGRILTCQGEYQQAIEMLIQSLELKQRCGASDMERINTLIALGAVYTEVPNTQIARDFLNQALRMIDPQKNQNVYAKVMNGIANTMFEFSEAHHAIKIYQEVLAIYDSAQNYRGMGRVLNNLGYMEMYAGNSQKALEYLDRAIMLSQRANNSYMLSTSYMHMGTAYLWLGEIESARTFYGKSIAIKLYIGNTREVLNNLVFCVARLAIAQQEYLRGAQLLGCFTQWTHRLNIDIYPYHKQEYERHGALLKKHLSIADFEDAWHTGTQMGYNDTIAYLLRSIESN